MSRLLRTVTLAVALSATPACAVFAARTPTATQAVASVEEQAYLLVGAYALVLDEATRLVRDPSTPKTVKIALGKAEAAATPALELVKVAAIAYRQAHDGQSQAALARAIADAQAPVAALSALLAKK
jgi:hypothetical protein